MDDAADDTKFCLKTTHQYYYQVQARLFVSGLPYGDFVVFSGSNNNIFIQRIIPDAEFWGAANIHVQQFYVSGILPELIGKLYMRLTVRTDDAPPTACTYILYNNTYICICYKHTIMIAAVCSVY